MTSHEEGRPHVEGGQSGTDEFDITAEHRHLWLRHVDARREAAATQRGLLNPDPAVRLATWHGLARRHVSVEMCTRLARGGFPGIARDLMRLRGDLT